MSILNTGRQQLAQADQLNKQSTNLRNELAANKAGLEMAERNNKQSMRGNALGGMASMAIADGGKSLGGAFTSNSAPVGNSLAQAEIMTKSGSGLQIAENAGVQLEVGKQAGQQLGQQAGQQLGQQAGQQLGQQAGQQLAQEGTKQLAQETTRQLGEELVKQGVQKGAETLATAGASTLAGAGSAALAAIPYIGWAAAAGSLAYSLFS